MGRKRKTTSKGTNSTKKNVEKRKNTKKTVKQDFLGGTLVALGIILLIVTVFPEMGSLVETLKSIFFGIFGYAFYVFPVALCIIGIYLILTNKRINTSKQIYKAVFMTILISVLFGAFTIKNTDIFDRFIQFCIDDCYLASVEKREICGLVGGVISSLLISIIGRIATKIFVSLITFLGMLCMFNVSFKQFFCFVYNIFASIANFIYKAFNILFRRDEIKNEDEDEEELEYQEEEQPSRREKRRKAILSEKMKEKGSKDPDENLVVDKTEQVEFDFNKLGGTPSKEEELGKQKRDEFFKRQKEEKEDKSVKEVLTLDHTTVNEEDENYEFPPIELLKGFDGAAVFDKKAIRATAVKLQKTLASFGVEAKVTNITKGPTVTRYELTPSVGVKVSKIVNLTDDIALNLAAKSIRMEAPIPRKSCSWNRNSK